MRREGFESRAAIVKMRMEAVMIYAFVWFCKIVLHITLAPAAFDNVYFFSFASFIGGIYLEYFFS